MRASSTLIICSTAMMLAATIGTSKGQPEQQVLYFASAVFACAGNIYAITEIK